MPNELKRQLGWLDAVSVVIGIVIGAGIFVTPQELARLLPSTQAMMLAWLVSGALVFCGALAFAELSAMLPQTGGLYVYLREAFGPAVAFSSGWVHLFALFSGATAYIALGFARYLNALVPVPELWHQPIAIAVILSVATVAALSTRLAVVVQNTANLAKVIALFGLVGLACFAPAAPAAPPVQIEGTTFLAALAACFFCYEGWSYAGYIAGELRNPDRDLPRIFAVSFLLIVALYLAVNLAYVHVLSIADLQSSSQVGADVAGRVMGPIGSKFLAIVILLSIIGSLNGLTIAAPRMYYAQSKDGLFLPGLDQIHPRFGTPVGGIAAHATMSSVYVLFASNLGFVLQLAIFAAWLYYAIAVLGLMRLRAKKPQLPRPYRMWGYPFTPILFLVGNTGFLISLYLQSAKPVLTVLAIMAISFPVHSFIGKSKSA